MSFQRDIKTEYELDKWQKVYEFVFEKSKINPKLELYQLLYALQMELRKKESELVFGRKNRDIKLPLDFTLSGNQAFISNYLTSCLSGIPGSVFELGSGFGRNLFWLWLSSQTRHFKLIACEITASGRAASELIAGFDEKLNFETRHFDFFKPEELIADKNENLIFTVHAIEQVPVVPSNLIEILSEKFPNSVFVHFEPLGWQITSWNGSSSKFTSEAYALEHKYNTDYFHKLLEASKKGEIIIEEVLQDEICVNTRNGTSVIKWRPSH